MCHSILITNHSLLFQESGLHLLSTCGRLKCLKSLDLSDCDIYHLMETLKHLQPLQTIENLLLKGNPCSMVKGYKDAVVHHFPDLIYLDGVEIEKGDRRINELNEEDVNEAEFFFNGFNITGLPKIPKEKNVKQTLHLEFWLPLFRETIVTQVSSDEDDEEERKGGKNKKRNKGKNKKKSGEKKKKKSSKKSKSGTSKSKKSKKGNPYKQPDEYDRKEVNNSMMSDRKIWSKSINFPAIYLKSPENNLKSFRDTFRSKINVKLIYLKWQPPAKKKKAKEKKKKGKKKSDKSSKSKKSSKSSKNSDKKGKKKKKDKAKKDEPETPEKPLEVKKEKEPKEKILKRITLANFDCDLHSANWKETAQDFLWSEDTEYFKNNRAIEYKVHLDNLRKEKERILEEKAALKKKEKEEAAKKKAAGKKDKDSKKSKSSKSSKKDKKSKSSKSSKSSKKEKKSKSKSSKSSKKSKKSKGSSKKSSKKSKKGQFLSCRVSFGLTRK